MQKSPNWKHTLSRRSHTEFFFQLLLLYTKINLVDKQMPGHDNPKTDRLELSRLCKWTCTLDYALISKRYVTGAVHLIRSWNFGSSSRIYLVNIIIRSLHLRGLRCKYLLINFADVRALRKVRENAILFKDGKVYRVRNFTKR